MDYQTTYNEAMAKLAEAQKCQDEIANCNQELQQVNEAIAEVCYVFNVYKTKAYLNYRCNTLSNEINNRIRERDEKLNEALSKALDLADDETDKGQPMAGDLDILDFFELGFTHYMEILAKTQTMEERVFYIHQVATYKVTQEHLRELLPPEEEIKRLMESEEIKQI